MTAETTQYRALLRSFSNDLAATATPAESAEVFRRIGNAKRAKEAAEKTQATIATADTAGETRLLTTRLA